MEANLILAYFAPLVFISMAVTMVVLRAGASRIFFDIVGTMQVDKLIKDAKASATIVEALYVDALVGVQEGVMELGEGFNQLMDDIIPIGREIGEAQRQFEKFVTAGEDVEALNAQIIEIGHSFGFAADESFQAGAKMAQLAGVLGQGSTATGTEMGMAFGLIAGMSTDEAMQRLVNLNQQTKFMTKNIRDNATEAERNNKIRENTIQILDQLNTVENTSVATMQQITFVMNQFASQAHLTGESIAAMAAMSAVLVEAGEEQGKGGRALRTIYARLGADTNGARKAIEELGIAVIDAETRAMRPLSDILQDVSTEYDTMTGAQKSNLAQTVAGNLHYTRLIKLLENTGRMRELEADALAATFPAYEEIERLQDTNLYQLEQTEARLKSVKGALADELMPAMQRSAEVQTVFFDGVLQLIEAYPRLTRVFAGAQMMRTVVGPLIQTFLAVQNLRIATEALRHVRRAMNGEDMFKKKVTETMIQQESFHNSLLKQRGVLIGQMINSEGTHTESIQRKIHAYDLMAAKQGQVSWSTMQMDAAAQMASQSANALSMGYGMLGTGLMMFGKSQKSMRMGMILNTFAMVIQMGKLLASTAATIMDTKAKIINNGVSLRSIKLAYQDAAAKTFQTGVTNTFTAALIANQRAILIAAGAIGVALLAAGYLASKMSNMSNSVNDVNTSFTDLSTVLGILDEQKMSIQDINAELEYQLQIVEDLGDAESGAAKAAADAAQKRADDLIQAKDIALARDENAVAVMEEQVRLQEQMAAAAATGDQMIMRGTAAVIKPQLAALEKENAEVIAMLERQGIDSISELNTFIQATASATSNSIDSSTSDAVQGINESLEAGTDAMYEFANAREELFYGFSASNLTGDLIRQVKQQGVENLITNTEVIMTNNFNGMTIPEVAEQIIEEIESRANLSGISLSMAST